MRNNRREQITVKQSKTTFNLSNREEININNNKGNTAAAAVVAAAMKAMTVAKMKLII